MINLPEPTFLFTIIFMILSFIVLIINLIQQFTKIKRVEKIEKRKIFNYDNLEESRIVNYPFNKDELFINTISAGGCLFYKLVDNNLYLLLIKYYDPNWPRYDDFGGKIDLEDIHIYDTISRETSEETNDIIKNALIQNILQLTAFNALCKTFYTPKSKYYLKLIKATNDFKSDTEQFGNMEFKDNIKRTIHWMNYKDVKNNLAFRLLYNTELIEYLDSLVIN